MRCQGHVAAGSRVGHVRSEVESGCAAAVVVTGGDSRRARGRVGRGRHQVRRRHRRCSEGVLRAASGVERRWARRQGVRRAADPVQGRRGEVLVRVWHQIHCCLRLRKTDGGRRRSGQGSAIGRAVAGPGRIRSHYISTSAGVSAAATRRPRMSRVQLKNASSDAGIRARDGLEKHEKAPARVVLLCCCVRGRSCTRSAELARRQEDFRTAADGKSNRIASAARIASQSAEYRSEVPHRARRVMMMVVVMMMANRQCAESDQDKTHTQKVSHREKDPASGRWPFPARTHARTHAHARALVSKAATLRSGSRCGKPSQRVVPGQSRQGRQVKPAGEQAGSAHRQSSQESQQHSSSGSVAAAGRVHLGVHRTVTSAAAQCRAWRGVADSM